MCRSVIPVIVLHINIGTILNKEFSHFFKSSML